jgi:HPt (histidine-containing phosphotransfer) domain-containing protein
MAAALDLLVVNLELSRPDLNVVVAPTLADALNILRFRNFDGIVAMDVDPRLSKAAPLLIPANLTPASLNALSAGWLGPAQTELAPLEVGYLERLAARMQAIQVACEAGDLGEMAKLGHQIAGTAPLYGLHGISRECDMLSTAARERQTPACAWQARRAAHVWRVSMERRQAPG